MSAATSGTVPVPLPLALTTRFVVRGTIRFETAWRIGTGREGQTMSDLGVLLDPEGTPVLPGSSLKGKLRGTCESLASALGRSACQLNFAASNVCCASDIRHYTQSHPLCPSHPRNRRESASEIRHDTQSHQQEYQELLREYKDSVGERLDWIAKHTCDVCKLFGSPLKTSKLKVGDGRLIPGTWANVIQVRDGVVLDRDSRTAVDGLKYDYEVVPTGTAFAVRIDLEAPTPPELALVGAALFDWSAGSSLGGFTSRGLGRFRLDEVKVRGVDFGKPAERARYLTGTDPVERLTDRGDLKTFFQAFINARTGA